MEFCLFLLNSLKQFQDWIDPFPIVEFMFAVRLLYNAVYLVY